MDMNLRALMFLGFAGFLAQPALAQQASAADTTHASITSLIGSGYEVKAVTMLSESAEKLLYPGTAPTGQVVVSLQKGSSLAVCGLAAANWLTLLNASLTDASRCAVH
jgi:hypothetical protein